MMFGEKKTNQQAYGNLYCTHQEKTTWQYEDCPESGCILHILVTIAQRIVNDLLAIALRNTKLVEPPITLDTRRATSYWQKQISIYLLFVMQKTHFLDLLPDKKDNICTSADIHPVVFLWDPFFKPMRSTCLQVCLTG